MSLVYQHSDATDVLLKMKEKHSTDPCVSHAQNALFLIRRIRISSAVQYTKLNDKQRRPRRNSVAQVAFIQCHHETAQRGREVRPPQHSFAVCNGKTCSTSTVRNLMKSTLGPQTGVSSETPSGDARPGWGWWEEAVPSTDKPLPSFVPGTFQCLLCLCTANPQGRDRKETGRVEGLLPGAWEPLYPSPPCFTSSHWGTINTV